MGYYPVALELKGRRCLVIGGGPVAERKVEGLIAADASVTVISPTVTARLEKLDADGLIVCHRRLYQTGDLAGYELAFVATDDRGVNGKVYEDGKTRGIWVNAADDPAHCDFILPSVLRRGDLSIAVSTGGKSPALSRSIREELEDQFDEGYASLVEVAGEVRNELRRLSLSPSYEAWRRALKEQVREQIRRGDVDQARSFLLKRLGATQCE